MKYLRFGRDIRDLGRSLKQLVEVTENARDHPRRSRRPWDAHEDDCREELQSLMEVTGDFLTTLNECQSLLYNRARFARNSANFVVNIQWHASVEGDVAHLKERVHLHITKLFFVIKPFEIRLLLGIRSELQNLRQDVQVLSGLVVTLTKNDTLESNNFDAAFHPPEIPETVVRRFLKVLNNSKGPNNFQDVADLPLKEGFDALAFHFGKSTVEFNPGVDPSHRVPEETQYLNLLKSKWILNKLKVSSCLTATGPASLWGSYLKEVEIDIVEEYKRFNSGLLVAPPLDTIVLLPDECFSIWVVEAPPVRPPDLAEQRALEDKILQLALSDPAVTPELALTVFRNSDVEFRMVMETTTTTADGKNKVVERESFPINMESTRLIPAYGIPGNVPVGAKSVNNLLLYRSQDQAPLWQNFKSPDDLEQFQQALTGYRVFYDTMPNVRWSLNGSVKPAKYGTGRVQIWQVKRVAKIQDEKLPSDQYALSPAVSAQSPSEMDAIRRPSIGSRTLFSSSSLTSKITGNRANGIAIFPPEPPVLIIFTLCEDKYAFLHIELDANVFINPQACKCQKAPQTCKRVVLEKVTVRKLSAQQKHEKGLNSWDLAPFRLPRHPKYRDIEVLSKIKYICFDFASVPAKESFREELSILFKRIRDWELDQYWKEISRYQQNSFSSG